jgi:peptidylprolyl isomerase
MSCWSAPPPERGPSVRRALLALLTATALLAAACGGEESPDLEAEEDAPLATCDGEVEGVTVTGDPGTEPTLEFEEPYSVEETVCEVLTEGEGAAAEEGDTVIFDFVFVNGRTGDSYGSSYGTDDGATVVLNRELLRGVRTGLTGARAGARLLVAVAPEDGYGLRGGDPAQGLEEDDTLLFVADVGDVRRPLKRAEGTAVAPPAGLPVVTINEGGAPTIAVPGGEPPVELVVQPLIEGDGPVVEPGQTIAVHYTGVLWGSGEEFDSSWGGTPTNFKIGTGAVIAGWDKGLVGRTVGSQVLLIVPPADGYGDTGAPSAGIAPTDTLVFVVDILDAY